MTFSLLDDLALAHRLADDADALSLEKFGALDLRVDTKPDLTPVSEADLAVEESIRATLASERPEDSVHGEEFGTTGTGRRQWVIDPIDGTKNFVRGVPVYATLIGLMDGEDVIVGVVSAPALGRRWSAAVGHGAQLRESLSGRTRDLRVSEVSSLADASFAYSSLDGWVDSGRRDGFLGLLGSVWRTRAYGDFWPYMMVAEGSVDAAAEPELNRYDMAALVPIVTEAGGTFTSLAGVPGPGGGNAVASNSLLHEAVRGYLQ